MRFKLYGYIAGFVFAIGACALGSSDTDPCEQQPKAFCMKALSITEELSDRNFRSFGRGERRIFKGRIHKVDHKGTEHSGDVSARNMFFDQSEVRALAKDNDELYASVTLTYRGNMGHTVENYERDKLHVQFRTVVDGRYSDEIVTGADPRLSAEIDQLRASRSRSWSFTNLEAQDIEVTSDPMYGNAKATLKHLSLAALPSPSLRDLIDSNFIRAYDPRFGSDLDLEEAIKSGALKLGETHAELTTTGKFGMSRRAVPASELPVECQEVNYLVVGYEAVTRIPVTNLAEASVKSIATKVLECPK